MHTEADLKLKSEKDLLAILAKERPEGPPPSEMATKSELIDLILDAQPMDAAGSSVAETGSDIMPGTETEPRWRMTVHGQEGVENTPFIKVQVNGRTAQIKRNQEVVVPNWVKTALEDAIASIPVKDDEGNTHWQDVRRFPFTVHGPA